MILGFSTQINGKPNYFIEKIWKGLLKQNFNLLAYHRFRDEAANNGVINQWDYNEKVAPKLHTMRKDPNDRWQAENKIDYFINCRQKNMFRFAPVLPVVSIQKIEIYHSGGAINTKTIYIDNECYVANYDEKYNSSKQRAERMLQLAQNDGFDTIADFFAYFDKDFRGKIIHWTDLKY